MGRTNRGARVEATDKIMTREERMSAHAVFLPDGYLTDPGKHLANTRDSHHYIKAVDWLRKLGAKTVLDVGCYDGWLDFLLIQKGFKVHGVEMVPALADAARRYADRNFIDYEVYVGHLLDVDPSPGGPYDAVLCFETLEHVPLDEARQAAGRFSKWASKGVLVSLPDQDHRLNRQHCWTPTEGVIKDVWGSMPQFSMQHLPYPNTTIPPNWFIQHTNTLKHSVGH